MFIMISTTVDINQFIRPSNHLGLIISMKRDDTYRICRIGSVLPRPHWLQKLHFVANCFFARKMTKCEQQDAWKSPLRMVHSCAMNEGVDSWLLRHGCHFQPCPCSIDGRGDPDRQDSCHEGTGVRFPTHGHYFTTARHTSVILM